MGTKPPLPHVREWEIAPVARDPWKEPFMRYLIATVALASILAACGGTSTPSTTPGGTGGAQAIGPVIIDPATTTATVAVGRVVTFNLEDPAAWTVETASSDGATVEVTIGDVRDGSTFNPGVTALTAGTIVVTLTHPDGTTIDFTLTIE
jgi:hypothetical protein